MFEIIAVVVEKSLKCVYSFKKNSITKPNLCLANQSSLHFKILCFLKHASKKFSKRWYFSFQTVSMLYELMDYLTNLKISVLTLVVSFLYKSVPKLSSKVEKNRNGCNT